MSMFTHVNNIIPAYFFLLDSLGYVVPDETLEDLRCQASKIRRSNDVIYVPTCPSPHIAYECLQKALQGIGFQLILCSGVDIPTYDVSKTITEARIVPRSLVRTNNSPIIATAEKKMWVNIEDTLMGAAINPHLCIKCGVGDTPVLAAGIGWNGQSRIPYLCSDGASKVFLIDGLSEDLPEDAYLLRKVS